MRHFKATFPLHPTISPGRQAVNRTVFGENSPLAWILRPLIRAPGENLAMHCYTAARFYHLEA